MITVPEKLQPFNKKKQEWRVVIETPKHSRNKYKFDEEIGTFTLHNVLPEGMSFPYDFGFLPSTRADDGDPIDVLLLMDEPAFCGCVIPARLIGVIEAEQTEKDGKSERNDRLVAISTKCRTDGDIHSLKDLDKTKLDEIQQFFVSYNRVTGKQFKVLNLGGPKKAQTLAEKSMTGRKRAKR
ncbi:MAG TPA: inorganic diphosphatase [Tepidisphaeraceae bacterium]|jgi:inorganic pyrophosphatase|nr:inorganic diphosphatase [Tepidisphaeraceae bacterium]